MFLRIVGARSAEQFDIIEVKIPFDLNIIIYNIEWDVYKISIIWQFTQLCAENYL